MARHKEHVRRLEQMLRLLDNETISPEVPVSLLAQPMQLCCAAPGAAQTYALPLLWEKHHEQEVADVKDLVDDYLDRNQEDFDDFCSPDDLYDDLLEKLDAANALDAVPALVHYLPVLSATKCLDGRK